MSFKIVILPPMYYPDWPERLREVVPGITVEMFERAEDAAEAIGDADAAFGTVPQELFRQAKKLRWIQAPMAGPPRGYYYPELVESDVVVTNTRGIFNDHLGAHITAFVLAFSRGLQDYLPQQQRREWTPKENLIHLPEATALIIGAGGAGGEAARMLAGLGVTVLATDARLTEPPEGVSELHPPEALPELLPRADFVVSAVPQTPATERLLNSEAFRRMKPTAFLINISRGVVVVLDDLVEALRAGEIAGAALDVYETEPLPEDHPLWTLPGVMMTPHIGGNGPYLQERRTELFLENCRRFAAGEPLKNVVDKANWF